MIYFFFFDKVEILKTEEPMNCFAVDLSAVFDEEKN
jgi:hypothetical protein